MNRIRIEGACFGDNFVINISDVHHLKYRQMKIIFQNSSNYVELDVTTENEYLIVII